MAAYRWCCRVIWLASSFQRNKYQYKCNQNNNHRSDAEWRVFKERKEFEFCKSKACKQKPNKGFTGNKTGSKQYSRVFNPCFLSFIKITFFTNHVEDPFNKPAYKDSKNGSERQVHPDADKHRAPCLDQYQCKAHKHPNNNKGPGHISSNNAL